MRMRALVLFLQRFLNLRLQPNAKLKSVTAKFSQVWRKWWYLAKFLASPGGRVYLFASGEFGFLETGDHNGAQAGSC